MTDHTINAKLSARARFIARAVPAFHITFFRDEYATSIVTDLLTLGELQAMILAESAPTKAGLPWLKLARFGEKRSKANSLRSDENVQAISGVEGDYDGKLIPFDNAVAALARAKLRALVYTSPSSTATEPKWRVVCPTSRELPPTERAKNLTRVNGVLGGVLASESFTLSQSYYFGKVGENPDHQCEIVDGDFVDERIDLDAIALAKHGEPVGGEKRTDDELVAAILAGTELHVPLCALAARWCSRFGTVTAAEKLYELMDRSQAQHDRRHDWEDRRGQIPELIESAAKKFPQIRTDNAPACSEDAIALDFATRHADTFRHVPVWSKWYRWDGSCWREDEKLLVFSMARALCREVAPLMNSAGERRKIASAKTCYAVVRLAGSDQRIAAGVDDWDADPWLLNTPDGVVDLRSGKVRAHRPYDYMTKQAAVAPAGDCPKWKKFLREVTSDDAELQAYLQRIAGYCLTGITREQELYFLYGSGRNGKGVFVQTIAGIIGDYHRSTSIDTFTVTQGDRHPTELAALRGARLVTSSETEEGRRWAEARIKEMTGGDKVSARFMRQDFFDYVPQFKLLFLGNHMPPLRSVNKAIRRRFNRVPFSVTISDEALNVHLAEELKAEWRGILAWMITGCLAWQRNGMRPPKVVLDATEQYLEDQDITGEWIEECCDVAREYFAGSGELFDAWKYWAQEHGEFVGSKKQLSQRLEDRGFAPHRTEDKRGFVGLRLKASAAETGNGKLVQIDPAHFTRAGVR